MNGKVDDRYRKERHRAQDLRARPAERKHIGEQQRWINDIQFQSTEAEHEHRDLQSVIAAQIERERGEQEKRAQDFVIVGRPGHRGSKSCVRGPEHRRGKRGEA